MMTIQQKAMLLLLAGIFGGLQAYGQTKPRIKVVTMGGTIANLRNADGSAVRIPIAQVISNIRARYPQPEVRAVFDSVEISEVEVTRVGSGSLNLNEFLGACREAQKAVDEGYDGIIVTHGTTTSEDTVYFLSLLVGGDIPIVLTNSQIQHMSVGNDGDMNLLNAIMVASARSSRGKTVLVANQTILSAREVLKGSEIPGGFTAGLVGPLGFVRRPDEGQYSISNVDSYVTYYREPTRKGRASSEFNIKTLIAPDGSFRALPRVEVLPSHYDARVDVIDALVRLGAQGLVVTGLPPGGAAFGPQSDRLDTLAKEGMPILHSSRNAAQYEGRVGVSANVRLEGDNLVWQKARILLQLAMQKTADQRLNGAARLAEIRRLINTH